MLYGTYQFLYRKTGFDPLRKKLFSVKLWYSHVPPRRAAGGIKWSWLLKGPFSDWLIEKLLATTIHVTAFQTELGIRQVMSFATTTGQQCDRDKKNSKNVKGSVSKWSSRNEYRHNVKDVGAPVLSLARLCFQIDDGLPWFLRKEYFIIDWLISWLVD